MTELKNAAIPVTLVFLLLATAFVLAGGGLTEDSLTRMIVITATSSMVLFSLTFSASSLHHLLGDGRWRPVMRARRRLGLSFALSHTVHLLVIIALVEIVHDGDYSVLGDIVGGTVIYLFIFAMSATSNDASVRALAASNWKRLHKTGSYLIWAGLFGTYLDRVLEGGGLHYGLYLVLGTGLLLLRIRAFQDKRKKA